MLWRELHPHPTRSLSILYSLDGLTFVQFLLVDTLVPWPGMNQFRRARGARTNEEYLISSLVGLVSTISPSRATVHDLHPLFVSGKR